MGVLSFLFADLTPVSAVLLSVSLHASVSAPYFLLVDAECFAWPRPLTAAVERARPVLWDAVRSEAVYPLLREWDTARHTARSFLRDAAITAAALLMLLRQNPETLR